MKALLTGLALALVLPVLVQRVQAQAVSTVPLDRIVAVVDDDVILQSQLDARVDAVTKQYASKPQQLPPRDVLEKQILDRLIMDRLQVSRAESTGIKISDAEIDKALGTIAEQNKMDVSQLRGAIEKQGLNYDQFRKNVRDQLLVQQLRQRVAQSRVHVSDAEIDSLIRNGQVHQGELHLGYIMIEIPDGASPEQIDAAHAKADEAKKQIDGGMDFAAAAIRYSNAENALQGGDLGWRSANQLPPGLVDVAEKLKVGDVSAPIRGPNGFHIIKLIGKREQGQQMVTEYHARQILIRTSDLVSSDQAQKKIAAIRQGIVNGEDFAKAAKDSSQDDATARLGGDLAWFTIDAYGPQVAAQIKELKNGQISEPFQTQVGWHILQLEDTRTTDQSGELKRDQARNILFERKAQDEYESFLRQIRSEAYIEVRLPGDESKTGIAPGTTP